MGRGPYLPELNSIIAAGINPKTGLPVKFGDKGHLKEDIKKALRIVDEQDAVNRFLWEGIEPLKLTSQEIERLIYYKGQLCFFYLPELEQYYLMPYALDGTIDFYGRFKTVHPVPMTSGLEDKNSKAQAEYLSNKRLDCVYSLEQEVEDPNKVCVLIHDYTKQLSQTIIPRVTVNDPLLDVMASCIPYMRTNLLASTGIKGIRVNDADQYESVKQASNSVEKCAQEGDIFDPIIGQIEFQELSDHPTAKSEEYMLAMQSLDNLRLSLYGIDNGGLFEKKAHELQSEADINGGPVGLVMQDGLSIREKFCEIVNKVFGLNIRVSVAQNINSTNEEETEDMNEEGENEDVETNV